MDLDKSWPYVVGGGLVLVLLILSRGSGSAAAPSLVAVPTSSGAGDALTLQREQDKTTLLGSLVSSATALTGAVNGYRGIVAVTDAQYAGEATLATVNGRTQTAIAQVSAGRDVTVNRDAVAGAVAVNAANADRDITIGKANARAATTGSVVGIVGNIAGAVLKAVNPFSWFG